MKIERETAKFEIGNFMILMKYYIAKNKDISYHEIHSKQQKYIYINKWRLRERQTITRLA